VTGLVRGPLAGPVSWHVRGRWLDLDIRSRGALLQASNPPGAAGGRVLLGEVGLMLDTRDREVAPKRGVVLEASAFASPRLGSASQYSFHGYHLGARAYVPLLSRLTFAARALYDMKLAGRVLGTDGTAVPFFERSLYEGFNSGEGLGGGSTVRGIARFRLSGEEKILGNAELRALLFRSHLLGNTQDWGLDVGLDAGRAQQRGYAPVHAESAVVGARLVWSSAVIVRVQAGRVRGGDTTLYLSFGEMF
jgi:outer membrane protein assembly factor BamA